MVRIRLARINSLINEFISDYKKDTIMYSNLRNLRKSLERWIKYEDIVKNNINKNVSMNTIINMQGGFKLERKSSYDKLYFTTKIAGFLFSDTDFFLM